MTTSRAEQAHLIHESYPSAREMLAALEGRPFQPTGRLSKKRPEDQHQPRKEQPTHEQSGI